MGCLATHIAWHHPEHLQFPLDAGVYWLSQVAGLNPVSSHVIREWDQACEFDWLIRADLLEELKEHRKTRQEQTVSRSRVAPAGGDCLNEHHGEPRVKPGEEVSIASSPACFGT